MGRETPTFNEFYTTPFDGLLINLLPVLRKHTSCCVKVRTVSRVYPGDPFVLDRFTVTGLFGILSSQSLRNNKDLLHDLNYSSEKCFV